MDDSKRGHQGKPIAIEGIFKKLRFNIWHIALQFTA
jgi:hypothetical protein